MCPGLVDLLVGNPGGREERDQRVHMKVRMTKEKNLVTNHGDDIVILSGESWLFITFDHEGPYSLHPTKPHDAIFIASKSFLLSH